MKQKVREDKPSLLIISLLLLLPFVIALALLPYAPMEPPLPPMCYSILPSTGEVIQIDRWQKGYNITRLDNALEGLPKRLEMNEMELDNLKKQFETAKVDVERPFPQEEELKAKTDRLNELNALLNVDKRENEIVGGEPDEGEEPPEKKPRDLER